MSNTKLKLLRLRVELQSKKAEIEQIRANNNLEHQNRESSIYTLKFIEDRDTIISLEKAIEYLEKQIEILTQQLKILNSSEDELYIFISAIEEFIKSYPEAIGAMPFVSDSSLQELEELIESLPSIIKIVSDTLNNTKQIRTKNKN